MRTFRSFQGVVTAAATVSAPASASRSAVASLSATNRAKKLCEGNHCPPDAQDDIDSGTTLANVANVSKRIAIIAHGQVDVGTREEMLNSRRLTGLYDMPVLVQQIEGRYAIIPGVGGA